LKLTLILAGSALELVPQSIASHTACRNYARKHNKRPTHTILDGSIHHSAMRKLPDRERRGRPDIVHFCLLEALGSPLNREGRLDTWVHTADDRVIHFDPSLKLPRSQDRFKGVMEKLLVEGSLENRLMTIEDGVSFTDLLEKLDVDTIIGFSEEGADDWEKLIDELSEGMCAEGDGNGKGKGGGAVDGSGGSVAGAVAGVGPGIALVVGGFAHGGFPADILSTFTHKVSLFREPLDAWTVVSRALASWEKSLGI
jgi:rRNA small subunit pseudouridine methyltransferase Nep1